MMGDFKALLDSDMKVFHNPAEFAHETNIWYLEKKYTVQAIIDHTAAEERQRAGVSIHTPARGVTFWPIMITTNSWMFQSTLPQGE